MPSARSLNCTLLSYAPLLSLPPPARRRPPFAMKKTAVTAPRLHPSQFFAVIETGRSSPLSAIRLRASPTLPPLGCRCRAPDHQANSGFGPGSPGPPAYFRGLPTSIATASACVSCLANQPLKFINRGVWLVGIATSPAYHVLSVTTYARSELFISEIAIRCSASIFPFGEFFDPCADCNCVPCQSLANRQHVLSTLARVCICAPAAIATPASPRLEAAASLPARAVQHFSLS